MRKLQWVLLFLALALLARPGHSQEPETEQSLVVSDLQGELLEVHFLDVGQGDAIYIKTPDGKHFMVDVGTRGSRKKTIPYLQQLGVQKLDGVVVTHSHIDHIGALFHMLGALPITTVYTSGYFHPSQQNEKTLKRMEEKNVPLLRLKRGDRVELAPGLIAEVLHPPKDWRPKDADLNNYSLVLRLSFGEIDFLLTGDAEKKSEKSILEAALALHSEVLKIGHHGSKTASSELFLDTVLPLFAVISCGAGNKFDHPHEKTVNNLKTRNISILRTDEAGTIVIVTDGKKFMIKVHGKAWVPVSGIIIWHSGRLVYIERFRTGGTHDEAGTTVGIGIAAARVVNRAS